ncbi:hypothetical protein KJ611_04165 [Patescibacteria group bacterium]|nr:hypothetical protein [Patescibacteria group bacterium]MBU1705646.1 hypothetical protein [Patescibacteria group bacterium]
MTKLEEVYKSLEENKKKRREIAKMYKDELINNQRHQEIVDQIKDLREEKQSIENQIKNGSKEFQELDDLRLEIQSEQELLSDLALNMYVKNEEVEIVDEYDNKWHPVFKVTFKKE